MFQLNHIKHALVIGGGHGIGFALAKHLLQVSNAKIFVSYKDRSLAAPLFDLYANARERIVPYQVDPCNANHLDVLTSEIRVHTEQLDFAINCVGFLHTELIKPEKSLKDIQLSALLEYFRVNSISSILVSKHLHPLFRHKKPSVLAHISAKVGSIGDNRLGGWYGYRASKAALNMFVKTASIEYKQRGCQTILVAMHPGTTDTQLSKPYQSAIKHRVLSVDETAQRILASLDKLQAAQNGSFLDPDGDEIPW